MTYDEWFKSLNENGRTTYFLGQEGVISKEAWDYQQNEIDRLIKYINEALDGFEAGQISQQEKIDSLLSYVENGGHTPNWIIREFLK